MLFFWPDWLDRAYSGVVQIYLPPACVSCRWLSNVMADLTLLLEIIHRARNLQMSQLSAADN